MREDPESAVERTYREHASRVLAVLMRLFGTRHWELAEDVLQEAFSKALVTWKEQGVPENPPAWIMTAAKNRAIDVIRAQRTHKRFSADLASQLESDWTLSYTVGQEFQESQVKDHQLRMIFMCASADLTPENRLPLMLRALCGFTIPAISRALLLPEATVKKRLLRTREKLRDHDFQFPPEEQIPLAMDTVHTVLYLLFNEGFHSSEDQVAVDLELCREAVHLTELLLEHPRIVSRDTFGLFALMRFHLARAEARLDQEGAPIPLDLQDRAIWDQDAISHARAVLTVSSLIPLGPSGRFSVEAQIAEQHCLANTFEETDWPRIVALYDDLVHLTGSPLAELNRAVAIAYTGNLDLATKLVEDLRENPLLRDSYAPVATLAHIAAKSGNAALARKYAEEANRLGGTANEKRTMLLQIERLLGKTGE